MKVNKEYGSKKKRRRAKYMERETKRRRERSRLKKLNDPNTSIEETAKILGIKLK